MRYVLTAKTTMKPYNQDAWWIERDFLHQQRIDADSVVEALQKFAELAERYGISISNNAIKNRQPMYRDAENGDIVQVGYVITGKSDFPKEDRSGWSSQFIDLWVEIFEIRPVVFAEEE